MDIDLSNKNLTKLPDNLSQHVSGNFYCYCNKLTSLEGAPQSIDGDVVCNRNKLTSLEGLPQSIGGNFYCDYYVLKDNENCYNIIGSLIRGRFKKYEGEEVYNSCLNVIVRYL